MLNACSYRDSMTANVSSVGQLHEQEQGAQCWDLTAPCGCHSTDTLEYLLQGEERRGTQGIAMVQGQ